MKKINPDEAYLQLLFSFLEIEMIPEAIMLELERRSEIDQFKKNEVVHEAEQESTHAYFIVSGIMMCYVKKEAGNVVKWFRSTGDYAYSMDMYKTFLGAEYKPAGNTLIALEDLVVVKILHEDVKWLEDNSPAMKSLLHKHLIHYNQVGLVRRAFEDMDPDNRYQFMQRHMNLSLDRIPDVYLSSFLDLTLPEVKKAKEYFNNNSN